MQEKLEKTCFFPKFRKKISPIQVQKSIKFTTSHFKNVKPETFDFYVKSQIEMCVVCF